MGDSVERALEETIPLLHQAQRLKLLTQSESRSLVQRRRDHEYALTSREATRAAFLKYAAFERDLSELLSTRAVARGVKKKKSVHVVGRTAARVNLVYSRAVRRFPGDVDLWLHYARHCIKTGSNKSAGKVFAKALGMRGDSERVWLAAVAFHFDTCGDARGGRNLAQRALRAIPDSHSLWKEYYRLEVCYLAKLLSRRAAMGLNVTEIAGASKGSKEFLGSEKDQHTAQESQGSKVYASMGDDIPTPKKVVQSNANFPGGRFSFWEGAVPVTALNSACKAVKFTPSDLAELWEITVATPYVPTSLPKHVLKLLEKAFPKSIFVRFFRARLRWDTSLITSRAQRTIRKASKKGESDDGQPSPIQNSCDSVPIQAASSALESVERILTRQVGLDERERNALCVAINNFVSSIQGAGVTMDASKLEFLTQFTQNGNDRTITSPLQNDSVENIDGIKPGSWSLQRLVAVLNDANSPAEFWSDDVFAVVKSRLAVPFRSEIQEQGLRGWITRETNSQRLREISRAVLAVPPLASQTLRSLIKAELRIWFAHEQNENVVVTRKEEMLQQTRNLFKRAIALPSAKQDVDLWLELMDFEGRIACNQKEASVTNWKAMKTLDQNLQVIFSEKLLLRNLSS